MENRGLFPVGRDENNTPNHISVLVEDSDANQLALFWITFVRFHDSNSMVREFIVGSG